MALDPVPWLVGGGAEHSPDVVRQAMYDASGGVEGISSPTAYQVRAQATPDGSVRVAPGGATLLNRYPGGAGQSYTGVRNSSQTSVPVAATGSSGGRTDAVILRVLDPQFEGQPPADPNAFQYTRLEAVPAPAGITRISQLNLAYPAILLARITIPANTATITNAMIKDLRKVARPQRWTERRALSLVAGQGQTMSATSAYPAGTTFPLAAETAWGAIDIPSWATHMNILMTWEGLGVPAGDAWGQLWVQVGPHANPANIKTNPVRYDSVNAQNFSRMSLSAPDEIPVPVAMRGTSQVFYPRGNVLGGRADARWWADTGSAVRLEVEFKQLAE